MFLDPLTLQLPFSNSKMLQLAFWGEQRRNVISK